MTLVQKTSRSWKVGKYRTLCHMLVQLVIVILLRNCGADSAIVQWFICFCNTYRYMNIAILLMLLCERKYNVASGQHGPLFVQLFIPVVQWCCFNVFCKVCPSSVCWYPARKSMQSVSVLFRTWQVVMKST